MTLRRPTLKLATLLVAAATTLTIIPSAGWAAPASGDRTAPVEARRVDNVPKPKIEWFDCSLVADRGECGTVSLPLDYDAPRGAKTEVALFRIRAANQRQRIGTLFLNPGGPGGSGVQFAASAEYFLDPALLERFDVVGFDPRGTNFSDTVRCWPNFAAQGTALEGMMSVPFPNAAEEFGPYINSAVAFGRACSTTGRPLSQHMSTANVARDMDVLRRTLGDTQLNYLGFSYGSYLGQVYANLFPDRVRALVIDGVLDPTAWAGTGKTAKTVPQTQRMKSGEGAAKAIDEILKRCEAAGPDYCQTAGHGVPSEVYADLMATLKEEPIDVLDPETGELIFTLTYQQVVSMLLDAMYSPWAGPDVDATLAWTLDLISGESVDAAVVGLQARLATLHNGTDETAEALLRAGKRAGWAFPYDNSPEAFQVVTCTDSRNPASAQAWRIYAQRAERSAPAFGPLWTWLSAPCASNTWTATDDDSYRGPFNRRTSTPVLVVGNYWDPATNYEGAVRAASLLPNSRLISSDNWGHTSYQASECVTSAVGAYLLWKKLPARGKTCSDSYQPFTDPLYPEETQRRTRTRTTDESKLPPVVPPVPGGQPRG